MMKDQLRQELDVLVAKQMQNASEGGDIQRMRVQDPQENRPTAL